MAGSGIVCDQTDERLSISGSGWTVAFNRAGDRWTHGLWFETPEHRPVGVVSAVESQSERDDPTRIVSPVYQELQRHELASDATDGVCLLLTGHFFQHHFSAAVSLFRDPDSSSDIIVDFDVADRCRSPVQALAATYLVRLGSSDLAEANPQEIAWNPRTIVPGRLELRCDLPCGLVAAEDGRQAVRVQAMAFIDAAAFTHRLRYRWRWESSS